MCELWCNFIVGLKLVYFPLFQIMILINIRQREIEIIKQILNQKKKINPQHMYMYYSNYK